jgi:hypothetical protein
MSGIEPRGHSNVGSDVLGRESGEIVVIHAGKELINDSFRNSRTERSNPQLKIFSEHNSS